MALFKKGARMVQFTYKCQKCHREVPNGTRFCIFCGQDLNAPVAGTEQQAVPSSWLHPDQARNAPPAGYQPPPAAPSGTRCPNGHPVTDPSLGFCATCGAPLVP